MKRKFNTSKTTAIALSFILFLIVLVTPLLSYLLAENDFWAIIVCVIFYLAYSPIIVMLIIIIRRVIKVKIVFDGDGINYLSSKNSIYLKWPEIEYFVFDYISIANQRFGYTRYYKLYELGSSDKKIRFNRLLTKVEKRNITDFNPVHPFQKKAFSYSSYGLYLNRRDCRILKDYIRDYAEIESERRTGLF